MAMMLVTASLAAHPLDKGDEAFNRQDYKGALSVYEKVLTHATSEQNKALYMASLFRAAMASKLLGNRERALEYKELLRKVGVEWL